MYKISKLEKFYSRAHLKVKIESKCFLYFQQNITLGLFFLTELRAALNKRVLGPPNISFN